MIPLRRLQRIAGRHRTTGNRHDKDTDAAAAPKSPPSTHLEVAIIIAMPSPRHDHGAKRLSSSTDGLGEGIGVLDYSLGLCRIPWNTDEEG